MNGVPTPEAFDVEAYEPYYLAALAVYCVLTFIVALRAAMRG